jgi:hypothetical protein
MRKREQDYTIVSFALDSDVTEYLGTLPKGQKSRYVNELVRADMNLLGAERLKQRTIQKLEMELHRKKGEAHQAQATVMEAELAVDLVQDSIDCIKRDEAEAELAKMNEVYDTEHAVVEMAFALKGIDPHDFDNIFGTARKLLVEYPRCIHGDTVKLWKAGMARLTSGPLVTVEDIVEPCR